MKKCEKYNMKKAFEEKRGFDFTISVLPQYVCPMSLITE